MGAAIRFRFPLAGFNAAVPFPIMHCNALCPCQHARVDHCFAQPHDVHFGWKSSDVFTLVCVVLASFPRKLVMIDLRLKFQPQINEIKAVLNGLPLMGHGNMAVRL